jgi:uncharacterized delta-60 repeat protein
VRTSISKFGFASALVRQPDGRLIVGGVSGSNDSNGKVALVRYNSDGSLDKSFGRGGEVTTAIGQGVTLTTPDVFLVRQPDGKLVAASSGNRGPSTYFALVRYNSDGSLDTRFGHGGKVTTPIISQLAYSASTLILQPDGKLVAAAGTTSAQGSGGFALVRYNPNGSLDRSFGHGGEVIETTTADNDVMAGLVAQPDGKLVAAGAGSSTALTLARYSKNGKLDTTFGGGGKGTTVLSPGSITYDGALMLAPDGKLIAAGAADIIQIGPTGFFVVRYNSDGSLDKSFGHGGKVTTTFGPGGNDRAGTLLRQPDGKLVAAGSSAGSSGSEFALARYNSDGSLDTSFGR